MLKFKRMNVGNRANETDTSYDLHNLIRQTALEYILELGIQMNKEYFIKAILNLIEEDLKIMIVEKEK